MWLGPNGGFGCTKEKRELIEKNYEKKEGVWAQRWIWFYIGIEQIVKKKMEFGTNGGFDFTKELKEMFRKKMGFGANGGFAL